jgi:hypothetical protein
MGDRGHALGWLERWVEENINSPGYVQDKASMRDQAGTCAVQATAAGITIAELKEAAGGDLERYLVSRQNELTDGEVDRVTSEKKP